MIRSNPIKAGLKEGRKYAGTFARMHDPCVVEMLALAAHPRVTQAVEAVVRKCLAARVAVGTIASDAAAAARLFDMGVLLRNIAQATRFLLTWRIGMV